MEILFSRKNITKIEDIAAKAIADIVLTGLRKRLRWNNLFQPLVVSHDFQRTPPFGKRVRRFHVCQYNQYDSVNYMVVYNRVVVWRKNCEPH